MRIHVYVVQISSLDAIETMQTQKTDGTKKNFFIQSGAVHNFFADFKSEQKTFDLFRHKSNIEKEKLR